MDQEEFLFENEKNILKEKVLCNLNVIKCAHIYFTRGYSFIYQCAFCEEQYLSNEEFVEHASNEHLEILECEEKHVDTIQYMEIYGEPFEVEPIEPIEPNAIDPNKIDPNDLYEIVPDENTNFSNETTTIIENNEEYEEIKVNGLENCVQLYQDFNHEDNVPIALNIAKSNFHGNFNNQTINNSNLIIFENVIEEEPIQTIIYNSNIDDTIQPVNFNSEEHVQSNVNNCNVVLQEVDHNMQTTIDYSNTAFRDEKPVQINQEVDKNKLVKCLKCNQMFPSRAHMFKHLARHRAKKIPKCEYCGVVFSLKGNLIVHIRRKHTFEKPYKCRHCEKAFPSRTDRQLHERVHTGETPFMCEVCGKEFKRKVALNYHRYTHSTGEKKFSCNECDQKFYSPRPLYNHKITRHSKKQFECDVCGRICKHRKSLKQHKRLHEEKTLLCKVCGKAFAQKSGLYFHMKSHDVVMTS